MIYYFSGTGNSLRVARHLADALSEQLSPMVFPLTTSGNLIGLVFPVYSWGIPNVVEQFVRKTLASFLKGKSEGDCFLYAVMTCGDDVGYADKVLDAALSSACGRKFDAVFSVQMPNTYVCLPGFDVDSAEVCKAKLAKEQDAVERIAVSISERKSVRHLTRGTFPADAGSHVLSGTSYWMKSPSGNRIVLAAWLAIMPVLTMLSILAA